MWVLLEELCYLQSLPLQHLPDPSEARVIEALKFDVNETFRTFQVAEAPIEPN